MRGCFSLLWKAVLAIVVFFVLVAMFAPDMLKPNQEAGEGGNTATIEPTVLVAVTVEPTATATVVDGGTLHESTVAEWKAATEANRLATAADWATAGMDLTLPSDIEKRAAELVACINEVVDVYAADAKILDLATGCIVTMLAD